MSKHLTSKDFENKNQSIIEQVYTDEIKKGRGAEKLIGELDKAGKNIKTATGWIPRKGNEHLVGKNVEKENSMEASKQKEEIKQMARER